MANPVNYGEWTEQQASEEQAEEERERFNRHMPVITEEGEMPKWIRDQPKPQCETARLRAGIVPNEANLTTSSSRLDPSYTVMILTLSVAKSRQASMADAKREWPPALIAEARKLLDELEKAAKESEESDD